jgi:hypothetical protein
MIDIRGYHNVPQTFMEKDNSSSLLRTSSSRINSNKYPSERLSENATN